MYYEKKFSQKQKELLFFFVEKIFGCHSVMHYARCNVIIFLPSDWSILKNYALIWANLFPYDNITYGTIGCLMYVKTYTCTQLVHISDI